MPGELDLNQQVFTCYRRLENFRVSSSNAIEKRSGTRLLEFHPSLGFRVLSTEFYIFSFRGDDTYTVYRADTGAEVKGRTPSPISQQDLFDLKVEESSDEGRDTLRFYTKDAWYESDKDFNITQLTLTGLPSGTDRSLAITVFGRSVIAFDGSLYFSKYGDLLNFTVGTNPEDGFVYTSISGVDNKIIDIVYFNELIVFATKTTLYGLFPPLVNPFLSGQTQSNTNYRLFKLYSAGVLSKTLTVVGNNLIFANQHGVYMLSLQKENRVFKAIDLTDRARHITSEPSQSITEIVPSFKKENFFFALRNDGVVFSCFLDKESPSWGRQVAGQRKYFGLDNNGVTFVTQLGSHSYVELNTTYSYFSDNKLRFSMTDEVVNLPSFSFLDAYIQYSELLELPATPLSENEFETTAQLDIDSFYTVLENNERFFTVKILRKNGQRYTHSGKLTGELLIVGKFFDTINIAVAQEYRGSEELWVTYADINGQNMSLKTRKIETTSDTIQVDSFFSLVGFKYEGVAHIFVHPSEVSDQFPADVIQFGSYCTQLINVETYTSTGVPKYFRVERPFSTSFSLINLPGVEWQMYKHLIFISPVGESGVFLSVGTTSKPDVQTINEG
jgi:hypothetical protein